VTTTPGTDATTPVPAVHLPGRGPRIGAELTPALAVVGVVVGVAGLVLEAANGFTGTVDRRGSTFPAWSVWGLMLALSVGALVVRARRAPGYRGWSMIEMLERPDGVVLSAGRLGARHEGLHVRRGETVEIQTTPESRATHRYVVTAPAGSMTFRADGLVHRLTMAPLEEAAARHGITVVTTGGAARITRTAAV